MDALAFIRSLAKKQGLPLPLLSVPLSARSRLSPKHGLCKPITTSKVFPMQRKTEPLQRILGFDLCELTPAFRSCPEMSWLAELRRGTGIMIGVAKLESQGTPLQRCDQLSTQRPKRVLRADKPRPSIAKNAISELRYHHSPDKDSKHEGDRYLHLPVPPGTRLPGREKVVSNVPNVSGYRVARRCGSAAKDRK